MQSEPVGPWWERSPGVDFDALVARQRRLAARSPAPGEYYHYTNLGYALLGEVVARLRGAHLVGRWCASGSSSRSG